MTSLKLSPPPLDADDICILYLLSEDGGFATADVSRMANWRKGRKHSAILSSRIRYLERHGLVGRLDDKTPIAWTRTPAGTAALPDDPAPLHGRRDQP